MNYVAKKTYTTRRNFGVFTEISKDLNNGLGDTTNRSVSLRTAQGFKRTFNLENMSDETAEDIVHAAMGGTVALLSQKNDAAKAAGILLMLGLIGCYSNGKKVYRGRYRKSKLKAIKGYGYKRV